MPTWGEILKEVQASARERRPLGPDLDGIRLKYLKALHARSGHAVISYVSGWLQGGKPSLAHSVEGQDVHGLMEVCYQVDERKLDLILHSPGGSPEAAEQMLEYLRTQLGSAPILRTPDLGPIMGQEGCHGSTTEIFSRVQT